MTVYLIVGLPSSMYPDIKLKDLLSKTEEIPHKDEINIKTLCASRPTHGIKTLLPVRSSQISTENHEEKSFKRKRLPSDSLDTHKGRKCSTSMKLWTIAQTSTLVQYVNYCNSI